MPCAFGAAAVMVALGILRAVVEGSARPLVGALIFLAVITAVMVPLWLMERSGRGVAAPMGTPESRWSMVALAGVQLGAAGAGAAWAFDAGHTVFGIALGAWAVLALLGLGAAVVGPAESMRGLRPGERRRAGA